MHLCLVIDKRKHKFDDGLRVKGQILLHSVENHQMLFALGIAMKLCCVFILPPVHCFSILFTHAVQMMKNCFVEKARQRERETILLEGEKNSPPIPKNTHREVREKAGKKREIKEAVAAVAWLSVLRNKLS